jgi:hypothetical protein
VKCQHCNKGKICRPRGLCFPCYYTPAIRERFPSTSKYAYRGVGNHFRLGSLPTPTDAVPGSPEKIEIMAARAAAGEQLHHPRDAKHSPTGWAVPVCTNHRQTADSRTNR